MQPPGKSILVVALLASVASLGVQATDADACKAIKSCKDSVEMESDDNQMYCMVGNGLTRPPKAVSMCATAFGSESDCQEMCQKNTNNLYETEINGKKMVEEGSLGMVCMSAADAKAADCDGATESPDSAPPSSDSAGLQCDSTSGPEVGPCPMAKCVEPPAGCSMSLEYELQEKGGANEDVPTCCAKMCNFVDKDGKECSAEDRVAEEESSGAARVDREMVIANVLLLGFAIAAMY